MIHKCQGETEIIQSPFTDVDVTATYGQTELSYFFLHFFVSGLNQDLMHVKQALTSPQSYIPRPCLSMESNIGSKLCTGAPGSS